MAQTKQVDITPGGSRPPILNVSQNDVGREIIINVKDGDSWFDMTDYTVTLAGIKPSGLGFTVTADISEHTATITTTEGMTDEYGSIECELKIDDGDDNVIGTANMRLVVEKDPHPDSTTDGSVDDLIPEITLLVERAEAAASNAEAWAVGQRDGEDVDEDDDTYENNAKYYAEQAGDSADDAEGSATEAAASANSASTYATNASSSANSAAASATADDAEESATSAAASAVAAAQVLSEYGDIVFSLNSSDNGIDITITTA